MPSRVMRGEINASDSLSQVSLEADLTFRALIVAVDDYGRLDARPAFLKSALFPMRPEVDGEQIAGWVKELAAVGCVDLYQIGGRPYLQMTGWEKHRGKTKRSGASKYPKKQGHGDSPDSPGDPGDLGDPGDPSESRSRESRVESRSREKAPRPPAAPVLPAESLTLSRLLIELLRDTPGAHIPPRAERQWATYIARMPREIPELAASPNPWETIEGAIRWALGPENLGQPYEVVIRSGRALLEKYPKLRAAERRKRRSSGDDVDAALLRAAEGGGDG